MSDKIPVRLYVRIIDEDFDDLEDVPAFDNWDRISYINRPVEISGEGKEKFFSYIYIWRAQVLILFLFFFSAFFLL